MEYKSPRLISKDGRCSSGLLQARAAQRESGEQSESSDEITLYGIQLAVRDDCVGLKDPVTEFLYARQAEGQLHDLVGAEALGTDDVFQGDAVESFALSEEEEQDAD